MIQQIIFCVSFTDCLEFVPKSSIPPLERLDVCHTRHPYIFFPSLGVMPRVPTALHLSIAHDDITRQLANCDENYKFYAYSYSMFAVYSEVFVTSHLEIVRKSHTWRTGSPRVLRRLALMPDELDIS